MSRNIGIVILVLGVIFSILNLTRIYELGTFQYAAYIAVVLGAIMIYAAMKQQQ